jgi:hypothetical protein
MNRLEFYEYYWDKTMKNFPYTGNRIIRKKDRLPSTIIHYLIFILSWFLLLIKLEWWICLIIIGIIDLYCIFYITLCLESNIIIVEKLYRLSKRNDIYSIVLISILKNGYDTFMKKYLSNISKLRLSWIQNSLFNYYLKYDIKIDYLDNKIKFKIRKNKIKVVYKDNIRIFNKQYITIKDLFNDIRIYITSLNESN